MIVLMPWQIWQAYWFQPAFGEPAVVSGYLGEEKSPAAGEQASRLPRCPSADGSSRNWWGRFEFVEWTEDGAFAAQLRNLIWEAWLQTIARRSRIISGRTLYLAGAFGGHWLGTFAKRAERRQLRRQWENHDIGRDDTGVGKTAWSEPSPWLWWIG